MMIDLIPFLMKYIEFFKTQLAMCRRKWPRKNRHELGGFQAVFPVTVTFIFSTRRLVTVRKPFERLVMASNLFSPESAQLLGNCQLCCRVRRLYLCPSQRSGSRIRVEQLRFSPVFVDAQLFVVVLNEGSVDSCDFPHPHLEVVQP